MFGFVKRLIAPAPEPAPQRSRSTPRKKPAPAKDAASEPAPLPQVVEGNDESDWALWEDSKTALDSQMQGLSRSGYGKLGPSQYDTLPSELGAPSAPPDSLYGEVDAFGTVRKRDR